MIDEFQHPTLLEELCDDAFQLQFDLNPNNEEYLELTEEKIERKKLQLTKAIEKIDELRKLSYEK